MMDDLHNKTIDVLKGFIRARFVEKFTASYFSVRTIIDTYYQYADHGDSENDIGNKIVYEWKLGTIMDGGVLDMDYEVVKKFLAPYDTNEYIVDRCIDSLIRNGEADTGSLLKRQQLEFDKLRGQIIEAKIKNSGFVEPKAANMGDYSYLFMINSTGIEILAETKSYSQYKHKQEAATILAEQERRKTIEKMTNPSLNIKDSILNFDTKLNKSQQSAGESSTQKINTKAPTKPPIINKIIIGVVIGLAVILIGHYVFHIG